MGTTARIGTGTPVRVASREETITVVLLAWTIIGLYLDAWSHSHLPKLESFFTPWHAVFYSGFLAFAGWTLRPLWGARGARDRTTAGAPAYDSLSLLGIAIFSVGGLCDMVWHTLYGLEQGLAVLLSPPHQLIGFGLILMASAPFRRAWSTPSAGSGEPALRSLLPAMVSLGMTMSVIVFMTAYLSMLAIPPYFTTGGLEILALEFGQTEKSLVLVRDTAQSLAIGRILITNLLLMAPALLLLRRWRPPFGSITLVWTIIGTTIGVAFILWYLPVVVLTGLFADWLAGALRGPAARVARIWIFSVVVPVVLWGSYFLLTHRNFGLAWPPDLWFGVMMLAALSGLGLSWLVMPNGSMDAVPPAPGDRPAHLS